MDKGGKITFGKSDHARNNSAAYKNAKHFFGFRVENYLYIMKPLQQNQSLKTTANYPLMTKNAFSSDPYIIWDDYRL